MSLLPSTSSVIQLMTNHEGSSFLDRLWGVGGLGGWGGKGNYTAGFGNGGRLGGIGWLSKKLSPCNAAFERLSVTALQRYSQFD